MKISPHPQGMHKTKWYTQIESQYIAEQLEVKMM
jgi:hypothetical protein